MSRRPKWLRVPTDAKLIGQLDADANGTLARRRGGFSIEVPARLNFPVGYWLIAISQRHKLAGAWLRIEARSDGEMGRVRLRLGKAHYREDPSPVMEMFETPKPRGQISFQNPDRFEQDNTLTFTATDKDVLVECEQEKAVDSYNQTFNCSFPLTIADARKLRAFLTKVLAPRRKKRKRK